MQRIINGNVVTESTTMVAQSMVTEQCYKMYLVNGVLLLKDARGYLYEPSVYRSNAGWYVGTYTEDGPHDRFSGYYRNQEDAQMLLGRFYTAPFEEHA